MAAGLTDEEEIRAEVGDECAEGLAAVQIVAEQDRPVGAQSGAVGGQPALGSVALAILLALVFGQVGPVGGGGRPGGAPLGDSGTRYCQLPGRASAPAPGRGKREEVAVQRFQQCLQPGRFHSARAFPAMAVTRSPKKQPTNGAEFRARGLAPWPLSHCRLPCSPREGEAALPPATPSLCYYPRAALVALRAPSAALQLTEHNRQF